MQRYYIREYKKIFKSFYTCGIRLHISYNIFNSTVNIYIPDITILKNIFQEKQGFGQLSRDNIARINKKICA